jgi:hypothetical protein
MAPAQHRAATCRQSPQPENGAGTRDQAAPHVDGRGASRRAAGGARLVQKIHRNRLGLWAADATVEAVVDGQPLQPHRRGEHREHERNASSMLPADPSAAESTATIGRSTAHPAPHQRPLPLSFRHRPPSRIDPGPAQATRSRPSSAIRSRPALATTSSSLRNRRRSSLKSRPARLQSLTAVRACTLAVRGTAISSASSPKRSPDRGTVTLSCAPPGRSRINSTSPVHTT